MGCKDGCKKRFSSLSAQKMHFSSTRDYLWLLACPSPTNAQFISRCWHFFPHLKNKRASYWHLFGKFAQKSPRNLPVFPNRLKVLKVPFCVRRSLERGKKERVISQFFFDNKQYFYRETCLSEYFSSFFSVSRNFGKRKTLWNDDLSFSPNGVTSQRESNAYKNNTFASMQHLPPSLRQQELHLNALSALFQARFVSFIDLKGNPS